MFLLFTVLRTQTTTSANFSVAEYTGLLNLFSDKSVVKAAVVATAVCATPLLFSLADSVNLTQLAATAVGGHVLRKELTKLDL